MFTPGVQHRRSSLHLPFEFHYPASTFTPASESEAGSQPKEFHLRKELFKESCRCGSNGLTTTKFPGDATVMMALASVVAVAAPPDTEPATDSLERAFESGETGRQLCVWVTGPALSPGSGDAPESSSSESEARPCSPLGRCATLNTSKGC